MCYAQCCHGDGSGVRHVHIKYHGHLLCHGDSSDGRHVCSKPYDCLRLFDVVIFCNQVVMGGMCVQSITAIHVGNSICYHGDSSDGRHVCTKSTLLPEAIPSVRKISWSYTTLSTA